MLFTATGTFCSENQVILIGIFCAQNSERFNFQIAGGPTQDYNNHRAFKQFREKSLCWQSN
jgi:hypothetical protein